MEQMIRLQLAIYDGDVEEIVFTSKTDLIEYLEVLQCFDCIWLATENGSNGEILITENVDKLILAIEMDFFESLNIFHVHEYQTYEDAYAVALDMREPNPKCYNNEN
jgi:hypothetical protein